VIIFRALKAAKTMLSISEAQFGTVTGELISPQVDSKQFTILATLIHVSGGDQDKTTQNSQPNHYALGYRLPWECWCPEPYASVSSRDFQKRKEIQLEI